MVYLKSPNYHISRFFSGLYEKAQKQGAYTALDAMKLFAIFNMTVDHIGAYMFPEIEWLRAIGRITFPVWFFLVGYSRSRTLGKEIWVYALILMLLHPLMQYPIFAVNALVTIIICRITLNILTDYRMLPGRIPEVITACIFLTFATLPLFEYGTIAVMFAIFGRMVREGQKQNFRLLTVCCYVVFIFWQLIGGQYDMLQSAYIIIGTALVVEWLARCPGTVLWPEWKHSKYKIFLTLLSRNTLPYYFYHRAIFQFIGALILGKTLGFTWQWFE